MLDKMLFGEEKPSGRHWTIYVPSKGRPKPKKGKVKIHNIDSTIRGYGIWSKFRQDMKLKKIVIN